MRGLKSIVIAVLGLLMACQTEDQQSATRDIGSTFPIPELKRMSYEQYGIDVRERNVEQSSLLRGQLLTDILAANQVPGTTIAEAARKAEEVVNLKKIPTGSNVTLLKSQRGEVDYFILEQNPIDYVVFDLRDSVVVTAGKREVAYHTYQVQGEIQASLFESVSNQGGTPGITSRLQEIFAWTVDFFRLQPTDRFSVIYREQYVEGSSIGLDRIEAAYMRVDSQDHFAFLVEQDSMQVYVDMAGNSLEQAFLKAPLRIATLPLAWTRNRRFSPVFHPESGDMEYFMPAGTGIFAVGRGKVTQLERTSQGHYRVVLDHADGYQTIYQPLQELAPGLKPGAEIPSGKFLGRIAPQNDQEGYSLRLRYLKDGQIQTPDSLHGLPAYQLSTEELRKWLPVMERMRTLLLDKSQNRQISSWSAPGNLSPNWQGRHAG